MKDTHHPMKKWLLRTMGSFYKPRWGVYLILGILLSFSWASIAHAQPSVLDRTSPIALLDNLWVICCTILVLAMNLGFSMLETGMCRPKNAVSVLAKNLIVFAITSIAFWAIGFALMFGSGNGLIGAQGFFLSTLSPGVYGLDGGTLTTQVFFLFSLAFAATAASIVSGSVAERITFTSFILFSILMTALIYPIVGHWIASDQGWLVKMGFIDFAGATMVHSVGGWAALTGAIVLGPRINRYDGEIDPMPGHNLNMATLGGFILWLGWFGFNGGSALGLTEAVPTILINTNLAAAGGCLAAALVSWQLFDKPDLTFMINGTLAGLVSVTAGCATLTPITALLVGLIGGGLVVGWVWLLNQSAIDDPVGAIAVHLGSGIWGTLAIGFLDVNQGGLPQVFVQALGIAAVGLFTTFVSYIVWQGLKFTVGLRVSSQEELLGLDISEHGMNAYEGMSTFLAGQKTNPAENLPNP